MFNIYSYNYIDYCRVIGWRYYSYEVTIISYIAMHQIVLQLNMISDILCILCEYVWFV